MVNFYPLVADGDEANLLHIIPGVPVLVHIGPCLGDRPKRSHLVFLLKPRRLLHPDLFF